LNISELGRFVEGLLPQPVELTDDETAALHDWAREMNGEILKVDQLMKEKRNEQVANVANPERLLWACETEFSWRDLGKFHYPQFIRTATCTTATCFSALYRCVPKTYTFKVLKKLERNEAIDQSQAIKLPENLRNKVKFINVTTNACCECALIV